jgi:voltage-gated potassium channel
MDTHADKRTIAQVYKEHRFLVLLILLLVYIVLSIILEGPDRQPLRTTLVSLLLLAAIGCLQFKWVGATALRWFGGATILSGWAPVAVELPALGFLSGAFRIVFYLFVASALIYQIARSKEVTSAVIIGSIDGYLLLGTIGAVAAAIIDSALPGSFLSAGSQLKSSEYIYFAFITMATVGYGDVVPVAPVARSLAVVLAVAGQLYVAVLMALLVGKYVGSRS